MVSSTVTPMSIADVEAAIRILSQAMPGDSPAARGPKRAVSPFRSCLSCMLSAQSLDRNTAAATKALFKLARSPKGILKLSDEQIAAAIKPAGLYNMKTRNIRKFCEQLLSDYDGVVPNTRDELLKLHGIGRKCADLVASRFANPARPAATPAPFAPYAIFQIRQIKIMG